MQDAFAHCAEIVRTTDRDRYIATLFAPAEHRDALFALYAFNAEIARVRDVAREPMPGEIRLQWWREVIGGERSGEAAANPVAAALLATIRRCNLAVDLLSTLIEAHRFDLYDEPMASLSNLEVYGRETSSAVIALAVQVLTGTSLDAVTQPAGIAYALANVLQAFPVHARRGQLFVPIEMLSSHGVSPQDIFAGRSSAGLNDVFAELRNLARQHLAEVRRSLTAIPTEALAALLPVALVGPSLCRLEQGDVFSPSGIAPWRRQWLIWRAARNTTRIATW
jgi:phytoene synthase